METYFEANRERWDELLRFHVDGGYYDLTGFREGRSSLHGIELRELGSVSGKSMLHLMCHFGLDTISWARLGAQVTGVDFSSRSIDFAQRLSQELGIQARFLCANVYDVSKIVRETYDIVYMSYGVLCWLPDLRRLTETVCNRLDDGGTFFIADFHPFIWVFDPDNPQELMVKQPYFHKEEPYRFERSGSYAYPSASIEHGTYYQWQHNIQDLLHSVLDSGLRITSFKEYPYSVDKLFAFMERQEDGYYHFVGERYGLPVMFSLTAEK